MAVVLEVWPSKRVGIRLSPNGVFNDMGSPDFRETFLYTIKKLNKLNLAYVHIMDGLAFGFHEQGEPMTLAEFRQNMTELLWAIVATPRKQRKSDLQQVTLILPLLAVLSSPIRICRKRLRKGWPLTPFEDMSLWYTSGAEGYTDYKPYR